MLCFRDIGTVVGLPTPSLDNPCHSESSTLADSKTSDSPSGSDVFLTTEADEEGVWEIDVDDNQEYVNTDIGELGTHMKLEVEGFDLLNPILQDILSTHPVEGNIIPAIEVSEPAAEVTCIEERVLWCDDDVSF